MIRGINNIQINIGVNLREKYSYSQIITRLIFFIYLVAAIFLRKFSSKDELRYLIVFALILLLAFYCLINKIKINELLFFKETSIIYKAVFSLFIISVIKQFYYKDVNFAFIKETIFMLLPITIAFFLANSEGEKGMGYYALIYLLTGVFDFYLRFYKVFTINNILEVSFKTSYSIFESELVNIFLPLLFFYLFVNKNILLALVSAFFCHLSMKRVHELYIIIFLVIALFKRWKNIKVHNIILVVCGIGICIYPILLDNFILSDTFSLWFQEKFSISLNGFTFGRENIYRIMRQNKDLINGLGDSRSITFLYFGMDDMHNDILRLYYECTFIGVIIFVYSYMKIAKGSIFSIIFMTYPMLVMMISPIISSIEGMTCIYLILFYIKIKHNSEGSKNEKILFGGCARTSNILQ